MLEHEYFSEPTPHIFFPQLLPPKVYAQLRFPDLAPAAKGRIGRDLYRGEPGFDELMANPGWKELHDLFTSEAFVLWTVSLFAKDMERLACKVDPAKARYEPFVEPRETVSEVEESIDERDPNTLFTRFDVQAADGNYTPYVHLDHIRRMTGGLLFCSDREEEGLEGGEFALYRDKFFADDRRCLWPELVKTFPVRHNTGVLFMNSNKGFHGPRRTRALRGLRKWVYYSISSHQAIWTPKPTTPKRELAFKGMYKVEGAKKRLAAVLG